MDSPVEMQHVKYEAFSNQVTPLTPERSLQTEETPLPDQLLLPHLHLPR